MNRLALGGVKQSDPGLGRSESYPTVPCSSAAAVVKILNDEPAPKTLLGSATMLVERSPLAASVPRLRLATMASTSWPPLPGATTANVLATPSCAVGTLRSTASFTVWLTTGSIVVLIV